MMKYHVVSYVHHNLGDNNRVLKMFHDIEIRDSEQLKHWLASNCYSNPHSLPHLIHPSCSSLALGVTLKDCNQIRSKVLSQHPIFLVITGKSWVRG